MPRPRRRILHHPNTALMRFELILPGLCWPTGQGPHPARGLSLPSLSTLLGFSTARWCPRTSLETLLATQFQVSEEASQAHLRRLGENTPVPATGHWLCCDPVHLHFARDTLLLADASGLAIQRDEADTLMAGLNALFADIGHFEAPSPDRWYIRLADMPRPRFHPLADVNGRPVQLFLPEGKDVARWARLSNELEVWLYNHPVNQAREASGQRTINGVWLWGNGALPGKVTHPFSQIQANLPLARGHARQAGIEPAPAERYQAPSGATLAVVDSLLKPLLHRDPQAWAAALQELDRDWFAPLLADLKSRRISHLNVSVPDDQHSLDLDIAASGLWKFWRKPRLLDTLLASAPPTSPSTP